MRKHIIGACLLILLCVGTAYGQSSIFSGGEGDRYTSSRITATITANKTSAKARVVGKESSMTNHITITKVAFTDLNADAKSIYITFDLGWKNSWRVSKAPKNWDAAWVFAKVRPEGSKEWQHAILSAKDSDHAVPKGATLNVGLTGTKGMGAFIYRSSDGIGEVKYPGVQLRWNYGAAGIKKGAKVEVVVFASEMVYVPEGSFYIGDGVSKSTFNSKMIGPKGVVVKTKHDDGTFDDKQAKTEGILVDGDEGIDMDGIKAVDNPKYPTGYKAFYIMKTEYSQGQYTDFLNMLNETQSARRYPNMNGKARHTISGSYGKFTASSPARACNWIGYNDGIAYTDWAGLRPMTELEFEKACRGPKPAVAGEYSWGDAKIKEGRYTLKNDGQTNSTIANLGEGTGNATHLYTTVRPFGPLRVGIFAASKANPTRAEAGATYYGVLEMTGSLFEHCVTIGKIVGRRYAGSHGDGTLHSNSNATNSDWPGYRDGQGVKDAAGGGARGGSCSNTAPCARLADRTCACCDPCSGRRRDNGGWRGVRSAPVKSK